jgi:hypothetical protein
MSLLIVASFLGLFTSVSAQNVLTETFVAPDQSFKFDYAPVWHIQNQGSYILLSGQTADVDTFGFFFFSPTLITRAVGRNEPPDVLLNRLRSVFTFIVADARPTTIAGREAAAAAADIGNDTAGFAFLIEMEGGNYGLVLALTPQDDLEVLIPLAVTVLATYDTLTEADIVRANMPITPVPQIRLSNYAEDSPRIITELELLGMITPGSQLVYQTAMLEMKGKGTGFNRPEPDIMLDDMLLMGELWFTPTTTDELESCGMLARVAPDLSQYLEIGLDNTGEFYYFDTFGTSLTDIFSASIARIADFQQSVYIIIIVRDERLIVFLNGVPVANNVRVQQRGGSFGVLMRAKTAETNCQFRNVRVYELSGTCSVVAEIDLNVRQGPGLAFESVGFMEVGATRLATAYHFNTFEDLRWWQLDDRVWVREDVVAEVGGCNALPPMAPNP